ncbi:MAG: CBS domain-containing protein [Pyrinomonadaceae bacterium]|nr:CBS domain-containing protein [Pyrinomonadaceae bacterium]
MGEQKVSTTGDEKQARDFTKAVLNDLRAFEIMLEKGEFEEDVKRIGAEQEMFLVDSTMAPSLSALKILEDANDERLTTEIGLFNLEANLSPLDFTGDCLSRMESELVEILGIVSKSAKKFDSDLVLTGILPTIRHSDLALESITPMPRYYELNRILTELHGTDRNILIKGLDELNLHLKDAFVEICNTSFQIHLQVPIKDFANYYNWSQAVSGPVLASAVNSPILLGHRLWNETRVALFKRAVDARSPAHQARSQPARVNFGDDWVSESILEILREDVARFRIILTRELSQDSLEVLDKGGVPKLSAWQMHNGTIWRWNRVCYGILYNRPSLRIEARYLPSGPTVLDEIANSAFFLGLMTALPKEFGDVREVLSFDDAKNNFFGASRFGINSQMAWLGKKTYRAKSLILKELLPRAEEGLSEVGIDSKDIETYLGVIRERVKAERTGAKWVLESLEEMDEGCKQNVRMRTLVAEMKANQKENIPVHKWELAEVTEETDWIDNYRTIEQFMSTDLFTVRPEDVIDLAASMMDWKHIRHVPVEDDTGNLVGIISHRDFLDLIGKGNSDPMGQIVVKDVMKTDLITAPPETSTIDALKVMKEKNVGSLPVIRDGKLVGLVTTYDFLTVSTKLFEERLKNIE